MRNESSIRAIALGSVVMLAPAAARASGGGMEDCPMHAQHQQTERESKAMGFSQELTTHHFVLAADGGRIEVTANAADDRTTIEQVRSHLKQIAQEFKTGDFATPLLVHGQTPPGVPAMRNLKSEISYAYEDHSGGAAVVIRSRNPEAVAAVQEFLRFQIREHKTGDPVR